MFKTLRTNWREIALFILGLLLALGGAMVDYVATRYGLGTWAATLANRLQGFSILAFANFAAVFFGLTLWPKLNHFANHDFTQWWDGQGLRRQGEIFIIVFIAQGLMAAVCFHAV